MAGLKEFSEDYKDPISDYEGEMLEGRQHNGASLENRVFLIG